ncbi:MAG: hypothetical protein ABSG06_11360 [Methanoregula sp.]
MLSIIGIIILIGIGVYYQIVILVVVCVGAVGGLSHELVQSQGKYMLPDTDTSGNFCLGGLVGMVEGAIAGVLLMQGQQGNPAYSQSILISAFLAGLALKGVSDAANPPASTQKDTASSSTLSSHPAALAAIAALAAPATSVPQLDPGFTVLIDNGTPFKIISNGSNLFLHGQIGENGTGVEIDWVDGSKDTCSLVKNDSGYAFQSPSHTYDLDESDFTVGKNKYTGLVKFPQITVTSGNGGAITYNTQLRGRCIAITILK